MKRVGEFITILLAFILLNHSAAYACSACNRVFPFIPVQIYMFLTFSLLATTLILVYLSFGSGRVIEILILLVITGILSMIMIPPVIILNLVYILAFLVSFFLFIDKLLALNIKNVNDDTGQEIEKKTNDSSGTLYKIGLFAIGAVLLFNFVIAGIFYSRAGTPFVSYHISNEYKCVRQVKETGEALTKYAGDNNGKYPETLQDLVPKYLKEIPCCLPKKNLSEKSRNYYSQIYGLNFGDYDYKPSPDRTSFLLRCTEKNHRPVNGYPRFSSEKGYFEKP